MECILRRAPRFKIPLGTFGVNGNQSTGRLRASDSARAPRFVAHLEALPDGMAAAALQLGEYRKLHPGLVEEFIFFDHPSGYNRILMAMRWKAEHLDDFRKTGL